MRKYWLEVDIVGADALVRLYDTKEFLLIYMKKVCFPLFPQQRLNVYQQTFNASFPQK